MRRSSHGDQHEFTDGVRCRVIVPTHRPAAVQMSKRAFKINIAGRVNKIKTKDFLVPLYEAISNSIHAIEAAKRPGRIDVQILRSPRQSTIEGTTDGDLPITGFAITDNGIGFDDANMGSFCEADSPFKATIGGKGVGRFSWLKFFEKASIESVFQDGEKRKKRTFAFSTTGIDKEALVEVTSEPYTTVRLEPLAITYESKTRKTLQDVSTELVEHFIAYLVTNAMPTLKIQDGAATEDIGDLYRNSIGKHEIKKEFIINGHSFNATGIRFYLGSQSHLGLLCGNKRVADRIQLGKRDAFFSRRFIDDDRRSYAFHVYVESPYLDDIVHDDRDGFRFPEPGTLDALLGDSVTKDEIATNVLSIATDALSNEIDKIKEYNVETVTSFVVTDAPQYRRVVAQHRPAIAAIHDSDKGKIDQALRRIQFEEEQRTRAETGILLRKAEEVGDEGKEEWKKKSVEVLEKLSEEGKANLAAYIVQRKLILDLLQKQMEMTDGSYAREQAVHRLIFPMRTTSDEVSYEDQNLWIVDERLSYHYYLASDQALNTAPPANSDSARRPDIVVFNRPIALNDRPEGERLESIVIIEFKRPGESSVEGLKHPVQQIQEYIELIQQGHARNRKGVAIVATPATYFFGYVICELDPLLKKVLKRSGMKETPDGRGMFGFFDDHKAYVEVISYEKLIDDARKRNRILFEKLQMPVR